MAATGNYFRFANPFWVPLITIGLVVLTLATFYSHSAYLDYFWLLGNLGTYLGTQYPGFVFGLFVFAVFLHVAEAAYSTYLCIQKQLNLVATIQWTIQTFLFGFASLMYLVPYNPDKKTH